MSSTPPRHRRLGAAAEAGAAQPPSVPVSVSVSVRLSSAMALQRLLEVVGSHHLTWVEDFGIALMIAVSVYTVLWCMKDASERALRKGK